ncbi:MAG: DNA polymerase I, partial [Erysipelotrichia bacterium]|nr:DNA polymerase I [Erysipelotrichia bacterium]
MAKDILLIDGNSMLFRAYHATAYRGNFMSTSNGVPTNAVFGFANMINKAIQLLQPEHVLVAWDTGKPTFRHVHFKEYKGTRKEVDEELKVQFPMAREFLDAYHIYRYEEEGIEADDIIGSLAKSYPDYQVHILSSDKDLLQLIDDTTDVLLMKKGISDMQVVDANALYEMMQLTPLQIIDFKGLSGDASDNIPGVKGVGEKTAIKLLSDYQSVEGVYENIEKIKGKLKEKLENDKEVAILSKQLATIKTDCTFPFSLDDFKFTPDYEQLNAFYLKYEMHSLASKVKKVEKKEDAVVEIITKLTPEMIEEDMCVSLDYDNEAYYETTLFGILLHGKKHIYYMYKEDMLMDKGIQDYLNSDISKFAYDVKLIYHLLDRYGFTFKQFTFDLMIACFISDNSANSYERFIEKFHYFEEKKKYDIYGKIGKPKLIDEQEKLTYLGNQIHMFYESKAVLMKEIETKDLSYILNEVEMPLAYILFKMEKQGVSTSIEVLNEIADHTLAMIKQLEKEIYALAGHEFNINSPKQLAEVLFDELSLKANKKRSTAVDVLEKLYHAHPVIPLLMDQRKYQKIYSTYAEGLKKYIQEDGKIHTIFNQCLTQTGRLSSSEPNLQNISVKDEEAKQVRKAFVASAGCLLYTVDYSQIELRMLAHMAQEEKMIEAFNQGLDIHTKTAMEIYGCDADEITKTMRREAKVVNFGIVYGQSEFGLSQELNITRNDAKEFMNRYFNSYPRIKTYMEDTIAKCKEQGNVKTL